MDIPYPSVQNMKTDMDSPSYPSREPKVTMQARTHAPKNKKHVLMHKNIKSIYYCVMQHYYQSNVTFFWVNNSTWDKLLQLILWAGLAAGDRECLV